MVLKVSNSCDGHILERDLIDSIQFNKQLHEHDVSFIKMLYESKLKKVHIQENWTPSHRRVVYSCH